jgi:hypothetical protein
MPPNFQIQNNPPPNHRQKNIAHVTKKVTVIEEKIELEYSLKDADRPLSDIEIEYENKAEIYNIQKHRRVEPVFGTLAFMFRNVKGGNNTIIAALRASLGIQGAASHVKDVVIKYDSLDTYSQKRIDVFDLICIDLRTPAPKIWNFFVKGLKLYIEGLRDALIQLNTSQVIENVAKFGAKESNFKDRELFSKMADLIGNEPLVEVNQSVNNNTVNNTLNLFGQNFNETIRDINSQLKDNETKFIEPYQLTEGKQEYIEAKKEEKENREIELARRRHENNDYANAEYEMVHDEEQ